MQEKDKLLISERYLRDLERKVEDLKTLMEFFALISSKLDFSELMTLVMEKAKQVMDAEACSILLYNKDTNKLEFEVAICKEESTSETLKSKITLDMGQGIAGWVAEKLEPLIIKDVRKDNRFFQEADKKTGFTTKSLIAVPLIGRRGLIGVAEIINPKNEDYDFEIFKILTRQFAIAIENALYYRESLRRERLKQELEIASVLQNSFLPESPFIKKGNVIVSALNVSAEKVGGDLYDFIDLGKEKIGVLIGDVSGKGISAALYMAKIMSEFRYIAHMNEFPEIVFNRLNEQLLEAPRGMFLTAIYMIIDVYNKKALVSVAGHPPFIVVSKKGVKKVDVQSGPPLGIIQTNYSRGYLSVEDGDRIILLTDGVFDAKNKEGKRMGLENIIHFIEINKHEDKLIEMITEHVNIFSKGVQRTDDITIVEWRYVS